MHFRDFHPNVQIRIVVIFVSELMFSMIIPFMAVYFAGRLGATSTGILLVISIVAGTVGGIYGGYYADKTGRKKLMLLAELLTLLAYAGMAVFNSPWMNSTAVTFVMVVLISVCSGVYGPASDAMLLDVTHPEQRKFMFSMIYWSKNLSIAIGGAVGAILFGDYLFELFIASVIVTTLTFLVTLLFIEETYFPTKTSAELEKRKLNGFQDLLLKYRSVSKDRTFMLFVLASLLFVSVEFHLTNYIGIRLTEQMSERPFLSIGNWAFSIDGLKMLGFLRTENTLLVVLLSIFVIKVMQKYNDRRVLLVGLSIYILGYSLLSYSLQPWVLIALMLIATWGEVMYVPVCQAYMGDITPEHARSAYMAVFHMLYKGAMLIGAIGVSLGGILPDWSMTVLIFITGCSGLVLVYTILPRLDERKANAVQMAMAGNLRKSVELES